MSEDNFLRPDYRGYSFAQIPALIEILFGSEKKEHPFASQVMSVLSQKPKNVILLLIDGFGYQQWIKHADGYPFLKLFLEKGCLMPITSLFPSTTAASITTICSGLTPQEHGLIEWHLYLEELDKIIYSLPFTTLDAREDRDSLFKKHGVSPGILFNGETLFECLGNIGVNSYVFSRRDYADSAYSAMVQKGSDKVAYSHAPDMLVQLRRRLEAASAPSYFYVYWDEVDHMSHMYEPHSEEYLAELNGFTHLLKSELLDKIDRKTAEETVLLITADHGHVTMKPEETIYLNQWNEVVGALAKGPSGKTIFPWGNTRDVFLKVVDERLDEVVSFLSEKLKGKAEVVKSQEAADSGLFGIGCEHAQFRSRIGNVLILPYEGYTVWFQYPGHEKNKHRGMHGGLSREEMLTVLGYARLVDLL